MVGKSGDSIFIIASNFFSAHLHPDEKSYPNYSSIKGGPAGI